MSRSAVGAVAAQGMQALASLLLQVWVARSLGLSGLGTFAVLYGVVVVASGLVTGVIGDSLVVLPRRDPRIRGALEVGTAVLSCGTAVVATVCCASAGLVDPLEAALYALVVTLFCAEEVIRRTLMASLRFWRLVAVDATGLVVAVLVLGTASAALPVLGTFLAALAAGQLVAGLLGIALLPRDERFLVRPRMDGLRELGRYGAWRGLQQLLRPGLLTAVRSTVGLTDGLAATGRLEAARVYTSPALLIVSGVSSYLFASFARAGGRSMRDRIRRADRAVVLLVLLILVISIPAAALAGDLGPLLFRAHLDPLAVVGWLAYAAAVAATTPYGALAASGGRQPLVFGIRLADSLLSLLLAGTALVLGAPPAWAPLLLAAGSLAGGAGLRLGPLRHPLT